MIALDLIDQCLSHYQMIEVVAVEAELAGTALTEVM